MTDFFTSNNLCFWIRESLKMHSAVFSLYFGSFQWHGTDHRKKSRWIESTYYFAKLAWNKKCCCVKYPLWEKISFFTISETSGWLLRRSALKSHLLITYLWSYVGLANSPWKNKSKNYAGLGGCLLRWITSAFISIILHILLSLIGSPWWAHYGLVALFNNCLVECQNILLLYRAH